MFGLGSDGAASCTGSASDTPASGSTDTCGLGTIFGGHCFLSICLYMLATDFSKSAMFWMFFRIPLSSLLGCSGSGGGGGAEGRKDTGRRVVMEGRGGRTNGEGGMGREKTGDKAGGRGGGGGGAGCGGTGEEGGIGIDWGGGLEGGGGGGGGGLEGGGGGGGGGAGISGGSGMISTLTS